MAGTTRLRRDADLEKLLSDHGIRLTEQRMIILRELAKLRIPVSHPELTERLSRSPLDRATIYRNLLSMTEAGILVRTQLGDQVWRFELPRSSASEHNAHPHFVCNDCGDVSCLPSGAVTVAAATDGHKVDEVQLRGKCGACVSG